MSDLPDFAQAHKAVNDIITHLRETAAQYLDEETERYRQQMLALADDYNRKAQIYQEEHDMKVKLLLDELDPLRTEKAQLEQILRVLKSQIATIKQSVSGL